MKIVYCDGACSNNPGPGAWAYVVFKDGRPVSMATGVEDQTTNNRMELMAAISALEAEDDCTMIVDSKYVKDGITDWIKKWKINGWKSSTGAVKNVDLWQRLDNLVQSRNVIWEWQKGHAKNVHDYVDELARGAVLK